MSRRRLRSASYRARRLQRHATRHVVIDEPMESGGSRITEYRRGVAVGLEIIPGSQDLDDAHLELDHRLTSDESAHNTEVSAERGNSQESA